MNNFVAKQIGRAITAISGPVGSSGFTAESNRLLRVAGAIRYLRNDFLCRFGDAPGGFHSATGDQLAFASVFGTRVDTVDLTAVMNVIQTGKAKKYLGECAFTDADVQTTIDTLSRGRAVEAKPEVIRRGVRLYHAYRAINKANGYTSAAFRCWPENNESFIDTSACMAMGLLLANGDVPSAGCESDWPTAIVQTIGTLLSGSFAVCLDWINHTGSSEIVQLGHCGMGVCGRMAKNGKCRDTIGCHPVLRQGGANCKEIAFSPRGSRAAAGPGSVGV